MEWRILIVDDVDADDISEVIEGNKTIDMPDSISCVPCASFAQAVEHLKRERFDLVILDLKDDSAPEQKDLAGEIVFDDLKKLRFIPVIFHTGHAQKVEHLASPFVKVVRRSEWAELRSKIKEILSTKLPGLIRHIEEEQRIFMWESAEKIWAEDLDQQNPSDLVYLLARRLANTLSSNAIRSFLGVAASGEVPKSEKVHAVELYIYPPVSSKFLFGDVFKKVHGERVDYFVAITPSCDHAQGKAEFVLLARCKYLAEVNAAQNAKIAIAKGEDFSRNSKEELHRYISDNSSPVDRFKYLPGTSFLPDLLIDLQSVLTVSPEALVPGAKGYDQYVRVTSLDSPFAESLQAKMARYLGRIGTPDIDGELALERFKERMRARQPVDTELANER